MLFGTKNHIGSLTGLERLTLWCDGPVEDLTALSGLTKLRQLFADMYKSTQFAYQKRSGVIYNNSRVFLFGTIRFYPFLWKRNKGGENIMTARRWIGLGIFFVGAICIATMKVTQITMSEVLVYLFFELLGIYLFCGKPAGSAGRKKGGQQTPPPAPPKPAEPTAAVCPDCGKRYPLTQVYCEECGALLEKR